MKYYGTKNNKDYGFYEKPFENAIELSDDYWSSLLSDQNNGKRIILFEDNVIAVDSNSYEFENNIWKKLSEEEVDAKQLKIQNAIKSNELQIQIDEIDKKRIRALCEPELKDAENGLTWLEYYNTQIQDIRDQIKQLNI